MKSSEQSKYYYIPKHSLLLSVCFREFFLKSTLVVSFILFYSFLIFGQVEYTSSQIEEFIENINEESDFDFNAEFEDLVYYLENPLDINRASREDLYSLQILNTRQIDDLLDYIEQNGELISIEELQVIPSFEIPLIYAIQPFIKVGSGIDNVQLSIKRMMISGENEFLARWTRFIEEKKGYIPPIDSSKSYYIGDPNQVYLRYRHYYENKLSYGLTMEKDPGEQITWNQQQKGFDFYSAHFYLRDYRNWLKTVALGDYKLSLGQGLLIHSGYGSAKSSFVTKIKKGGRAINKFNSVAEFGYMRGAAIEVSFAKKLSAIAFFSRDRRDANIIDLEETVFEDDLIGFSAFQNSGLHRTQLEIDDRNALIQSSLGGRIRYENNKLIVDLNTIYHYFDKPLSPSTRLYQKYRFSGKRLLNTSLDYSYSFRNFHFFGETALGADNYSIATLNGLLIGLDRKLDLVLLQRYFPSDFHSLLANAFAETAGTSNENGFYAGLEYRPSHKWNFKLYLDTWEHPWLRYNTDSKSQGREIFSRISYIKKRKLELYLQYRYEIKEASISSEHPIDALSDTKRQHLRLHFSNKLNPYIELRNRIEWSYFLDANGNASNGMMFYQDVIYKPIGIPFSFTARMAIFDTDSYDARIYAYENDILHSFSIPAYYNKGIRSYLNLRYKGIKDTTIEFRYEQTFIENKDYFSSGLEQIDGHRKSRVKFQIKRTFK